MEMMIFDVRYKELQEHGTLPNCFRFSLEEILTEKMVDKFIQDYSCIKEAASTICILGASNLTTENEDLSGVEKFHLKAVNKIIRKMERSNFLHVTTCEEGFEKCHQLCKEYDLRIQEHYPEDCYYCIKDSDKDTNKSEGTFKLLQGKFSSLYEKMGQKFKDLMTRKNTEFQVEDMDEELSESIPLSSFQELDSNNLAGDSTVELKTVEEPSLFKISSIQNTKSEKNKIFPPNTNLKLSFDSKSRQPVSIRESKKLTFQKKSKNFKNRSSEFSKGGLKMLEKPGIHRHSNDLHKHQSKNIMGEHKRMHGSGYVLQNMDQKLKIATQSSAQESRTQPLVMKSSKNKVSSCVLPVSKRSSSAYEESKKRESPKGANRLMQSRKNKSDQPLLKKTKKRTNSKDVANTIPFGLSILEEQGPEGYYSRFGISKILKLPITKCDLFFSSHGVEIFQCKKVKTVQGKQKKPEDEELFNQLFPNPYNIYLLVTDKAVFTTLDLKNDSKHHNWMYVDSRYTMYDLVKITSRKNSGNMITFYFRTPKFHEYDVECEKKFLDNLNKKPSPNYIFAHRRKEYIEICVVVEFENSEVAHQCIGKVSHLYKVLKHYESNQPTPT